jgi:hypothetical protein
MLGFVDVLENFVARKIVQSNIFSKHFNNINNERQEKKIIGTKVASKVTNVRSFPWCKSSSGSEIKTKQAECIVEMVDYIRKSDIRPI